MLGRVFYPPIRTTNRTTGYVISNSPVQSVILSLKFSNKDNSLNTGTRLPKHTLNYIHYFPVRTTHRTIKEQESSIYPRKPLSIISCISLHFLLRARPKRWYSLNYRAIIITNVSFFLYINFLQFISRYLNQAQM